MVRTGLTPAPGLGFSPKRGSGTAGYASKALAGRSGSLAAVQSRRRTSSNSDLSDKL